jgi:hypothetical protein
MRKPTPLAERLRGFQLFIVIFVAIVVLHGPLLHLPFFWDEAGFYVPAAYDLAHFHSLIPQTTLDTGHPPLPAAYLALWLTIVGWAPGWTPFIARLAQLLLAALALTNVFLLARKISNWQVATASTIATAIYPVFFAQSSLAHADLAAAAFTLIGIRLAIENRADGRQTWAAQFAFCVAVLCKETAIITPLALGFFELIRRDAGGSRKRLATALPYLTSAVPLALWLIYHHHVTGRFFGNPEFYKYNVSRAITPVRFLLAFMLRLWHLFGTMNMLALTGAMIAAMWFPAVTDEDGERRRIAIPVQLQFALIMLAYVVTFSLLGGALLTRYLLPAYPLLIIIAISTLRRRILSWQWPTAILVIFFVMALFFDPPYRFAPEDNLTYRDYVTLHQRAADFLQQHERDATILTAWPATDELSKTYLGYVHSPLNTFPVPDFTLEEMVRAQAMKGKYQVVYLFSTKYEAATWFQSERWDALNRKFFDYHRDLPPDAAAQLLGGKVVFVAREKAEWVEIIEMEQGAMAMTLNER